VIAGRGTAANKHFKSTNKHFNGRPFKTTYLRNARRRYVLEIDDEETHDCFGADNDGCSVAGIGGDTAPFRICRASRRYDVVLNGQIVGRDPDPNIRFQLLREAGLPQ
jgi:hypothetical protein